MPSGRLQTRVMFASAVGAACVLFVGWGGCASRFHVPPPQTPAQPTTTTTSLPAMWKLPPPRYGNWLFERRDLLHEEPAGPSPYARQTRPGRIIEGRLIGSPFLPIKSYLRRPEMTPAEMNALPKAPLLRAYAALMLELDSPMPLYPLVMPWDASVIDVSNIGCFDRTGHRLDYGTITREVRVEGREGVFCRAGWFPDCVRLRIDLRLRFPWSPSVDVTEYLWLADGLGEVRRVEHITGWMWLFWIESAYEYSLASFEPVEAKSPTRPAVSQPVAEPINWSCIAVVFDRVFPRPRVSGMYVEQVADPPYGGPDE